MPDAAAPGDAQAAVRRYVVSISPLHRANLNDSNGSTAPLRTDCADEALSAHPACSCIAAWAASAPDRIAPLKPPDWANDEAR